jgi:hypothetical protein
VCQRLQCLSNALVWQHFAAAPLTEQHQGKACAAGMVVKTDAAQAEALGAAPGSWSRRPGTGCPSPRS